MLVLSIGWWDWGKLCSMVLRFIIASIVGELGEVVHSVGGKVYVLSEETLE